MHRRQEKQGVTDAIIRFVAGYGSEKNDNLIDFGQLTVKRQPKTNEYVRKLQESIELEGNTAFFLKMAPDLGNF